MLREALAWLNPHALRGHEQVEVLVAIPGDATLRKVHKIVREECPNTLKTQIVLVLEEEAS